VFGADLEEALNNDIGRDNQGVFLEYLSDYSATCFLPQASGTTTMMILAPTTVIA